MSDTETFLRQSRVNPFFEVLESEFARARRHGTHVTLVFIKVSQISEAADRLGHETAEKIVGEIGKVIRENIRVDDREFMYGRDEFMIILPNTAKNGAGRMVAKLKRLIEKGGLSLESPIRLKPQFGIASYPADVAGPTRDNVLMELRFSAT